MTPQQIVYNSTSWKDFETKINKLPYNERGVAFEWFCKFYLMVHPVYRLGYKNILHSSEFLKNKTITKRLGFYSKEEGTDLIGETHEGKYEIIQCKFKDDKNKNLEAEDLQASIDVATGKEASKWVDTILMCSNLKGLAANKRREEEHKLQFRVESGGKFEALDKNDFQNIKRAIDQEIPKLEPNVLRKHQKKAMHLVLEHFKKNKRGQLIHACGTGKTLTSYFVYRKIQPKLTLFLVPSLQLINQTLIEWSKESLANGSPISPLVVCSDKKNEKISEHDPQLWLQELGIKVSNDLDDLKTFLVSKRKNKVIFSTYQSGKVLAQNLIKLGKTIDLAIFDEAHNTVSSKSKLFGYLLFDKNINIRKRLFMTATPKKLVGSNDRLLSMDDEEIYGTVIDEITVKDAIDDLKLLNEYKIVTQLVDNTTVKNLLEDNPFVIDEKRLPEEVELKLISSGITLDKTIRDKKIKNIVSFHNRINRAKAFQKGLKNIVKAQPINAYHVHGKQSGTERLRILEEFVDNAPSLVTNARCLSEGVNVPSIDAVMFVDPKQSKIDITQAIGRALRKGKKAKGNSYIIIPIVVDPKNVSSVDEAYQEIMMVLRSMSEHDGRIVEYFRLIALGKKPTRNFLEIETEYLPEKFDLKEFTNSLNAKAWSRFAKLGRRPFTQAREWARGLGINSMEWRDFAKSKKKPADIPADPARAYAKEWTDWRDFLGAPSEKEEMKQYIREYKAYAKGKIIPFPKDEMVTDSSFPLGNKMRAMRNSYLNNQLPKWKEDIVEKELIAKGLYDWDGRDAFSWKLHFAAYKNFKEKTGKDVPKKGTIYNKLNIETWYQNQKVKYQKYKGEASERKVAPLEKWQLNLLKSINFDFSTKLDKASLAWIKNYKEYKPIIEKNKGKVPRKVKPAAKWVSSQKRRYNEGTLEQDRINLLEKIKYWRWNVFDEKFEENLQKLEEFYKKTKNSNPKQSAMFKGFKIGMFVTRIRSKFRENKLDSAVITRITKLGIKLKPSRQIGSVYYYD